MPEAPPAPVKPMGFIESMMSHASQPGVPVPAPVIAPPIVPPPAPAAATPPPVVTPTAVEAPTLPDFAPTPAPKVEIDDEPAASPRAKDWKAIKAERDDWRRKYEEAQTQARTVIAPDLSKELESLKAEREQLSTKLREVAVEKHPQFVAHFDAKRKDIIESVTRNVGDGAQKIADLLALPNSTDRNRLLDEAVSSMSPLQQAYVGNSVVMLDQIARERQAEIAKSSQNFDAIQQQQAAQQEARKSDNEKLFNSVLERASALPVFQTREGDAEWNKGVENRRAVARNIAMGNIGPEGVFKAATWAAAAPALLEDLNAARASETELRARIRQLEGASPNIRPTDHQKIETEGGKPMTMAEAVSRKTFGK